MRITVAKKFLNFFSTSKGNHASAAKGIVAEILFALRSCCNVGDCSPIKIGAGRREMRSKKITHSKLFFMEFVKLLERIARFR